MEEGRMRKKILTQELEGTRIRERPRKRWKEEVERDLHVLGVRRWREKAADRKKWKGIIRQAKAYSGLECQRKKKMKSKRFIVYQLLVNWNGTENHVCGGSRFTDVSFPFFFSPMTQQPNSALGSLIVEVSRSHIQTHTHTHLEE